MSTELTAATNPGSRALGARGVQPATIAELVQWAEFVVKSGICPRGIDTKEKVIIAIQHVMELGLPIQGGLQSCMVVNNRVSLWGEMVIGIIQAHPEFEDMDVSYEGKGDEFTCLVTIKRKGQTPWTGKFSIGQARNAGLLTDPNKKDTWGKYEEDMLFWRAFSRAKRIFSDVLKGVKMPHEIQDEDRGLGFDNARNVTPAPAKPELTEPADKTSARAELKKAREQVEKESAAAAAPQTIFHTGGPAPAPATKVVGDSPEAGPFDHTPNALEMVLARLKKANISQLAFLKILAANNQIQPAMIERGLNFVPQQVLQNALDDWEEVLSQIAAPPR